MTAVKPEKTASTHVPQGKQSYYDTLRTLSEASVSQHFRAFEDIASTVRAILRPGALVGATATSLVGGGQEIEGRAAVSLFAAHLDPVGPPPRAIRIGVELVDGEWEVTSDADLGRERGTLILLADPATFPTGAFLDDLATRAPELTVVGGLASVGGAPGANRLVADDRLLTTGAVGLLLPPEAGITALVSQGGEPVGEPLVVTRASGQMIEEIAGRPALDRVLGLADDSLPEVRTRLARGLALGVVLDERKVDLDRGDFLVRPVLGADKARGAVAVGAEVAVGTTVQFQVRDAAAADDDLRALLADAPGRAALVFTGTARGTQLFGVPHHDAAIVHEHVEGGAVAGMFCAGEVGPVGARSHLHAGSAVVVLLDG